MCLVLMIAVAALYLNGCATSGKKGVSQGSSAPDAAQLVEMKITDVVFDFESQGYVIRAEAAQGKRIGTVVPIVVGEREASVLKMKLARQAFTRPLTHDLALKMVSALGGTVKHVVVEELRDGVFLARVYVADASGVLHALDSRASDAIILGVYSGIKIHFTKKVLDQAGIKPEKAEVI